MRFERLSEKVARSKAPKGLAVMGQGPRSVWTASRAQAEPPQIEDRGVAGQEKARLHEGWQTELRTGPSAVLALASLMIPGVDAGNSRPHEVRHVAGGDREAVMGGRGGDDQVRL